MKLLIDSHALIWALLHDHRLSSRAKEVFRDLGVYEPYFSIVSLWELSLKISNGKLRTIGSSIACLRDEMKEHGISLLPLQLDHVLAAERLTFHHRDPFDRLLIAQAVHERMAIVSDDASFRSYPVEVLW